MRLLSEASSGKFTAGEAKFFLAEKMLRF